MAIASEDKIIDALAIRDTSDHASSVSENRGYIPKTIVIYNGLNQQVSIQLQGSIDAAFTKPIDIGSQTNIAETTDDYATLSDYFPFFRVVASCVTAPIAGTLTVYLAKVSS